MADKNPDEPIEIDVERFRAFYAHFPSGKALGPTGEGRAGEKHHRVDSVLRERLGVPPQNGKAEREFWLGSKSSLEGWKTGEATPRPRERKVLQAIYDEWRFDISASQEFSDRIVVERPVAELLGVEGVSLDGSNPGFLTLKLKHLKLLTKVREVKDRAGRILASRAQLGFSEVTLAVELPEHPNSGSEAVNSYKIILRSLDAGQSQQWGRAEGMTVRIDGERLAWRLFAAPVINGDLLNAQLMDLHDPSVDEIVVRVEAAMADFSPVVFLDEPSGDRAKDAEEKERAKLQLQEQILRRRLNKDEDRYILASGRVARK